LRKRKEEEGLEKDALSIRKKRAKEDGEDLMCRRD
jgi:hypothetical protein